jgi:hypothetical protein
LPVRVHGIQLGTPVEMLLGLTDPWLDEDGTVHDARSAA